MTNVRIEKAEYGWALYVGKDWVADFSSKTVALYISQLLDSDNLLRYLVLGERSLER